MAEEQDPREEDEAREEDEVGATGRRRVGYPLIVAAIVGFGALLVMQSSFRSGSYSIEIAEVKAEPATYDGRDVKLVGRIKKGTASQDRSANSVETRFVMHDRKGHEVRIVYPSSPPDPFKGGRRAIVEGTFRSDGVVEAERLTVKCPSKYDKKAGGDSERSKEYYRERYGPGAADGPDT